MATISIKSSSKITVPKGATKKRKKRSFAKYFPKKKKIDPNKTPKYVKEIVTKKRLLPRKKMYK